MTDFVSGRTQNLNQSVNQAVVVVVVCVVQVPYELLNKKFRAAHKNVDREVARVQSAANELEKCLQRPSTIADLTLALDNVAEKLTQLKRKVSCFI